MEIPTPSAESIGKFFGGTLVAITAGWVIVKKYILPSKIEEEPVEEQSVTRYLRRAEDSGLKMAVEKLEERIDRIEERVDKRFADERTFFLDQLERSEQRISNQVTDVGRRLDEHHQGLNERLDILLKK